MVTRDAFVEIPVERCPNPATFTGAGDHFNAGAIAGELMGFTSGETLAFATHCAAYYVSSGAGYKAD